MRLRAFSTAVLAFAWIATSGRAWAHSQPFSWVELHAEPGGMTGEATAHVVDLAHVAGIPAPESLQTATGLARHAGDVLRVFADALALEADGAAVRPAWGAVVADPGRHAVRASFRLGLTDPREVTLARRLFVWEDVHETYFNVHRGGTLVHQDLLDARHPRSVWRSERGLSVATVVRRFIGEGIHHIFIGPDHILFIIGLLLLGGGLARLAKVVTAFTIAHSITLMLATLGGFTPPARLIEPLIALSIVIVGVENLWSRRSQRDIRARLAFGFGLVHGFGFASVLRELALPAGALGASLASFNVGVELGQMAIVLALAPALGRLRSWRPALGDGIMAWGSAAVIVAGAWWFVERVTGS